MSEYQIPEDLKARYDEIKNVGQDACEYAIEQLPLIERISRLESENQRLRQALTNMIVICGKPMREEWLNEEAFADATKIVEEARAALAEKGLI